jgi:hypothetical protein
VPVHVPIYCIMYYVHQLIADIHILYIYMCVYIACASPEHGLALAAAASGGGGGGSCAALRGSFD